MFRKNRKHLQENLFGFSNPLPDKMQEELLESEFHKFYEIIFLNIKEEDFKCLYSEIGSRPNSPVNVLVSSIILMHRYRWTYEQLFQQIKFNLLVKTALGLKTIEEIPFNEATMFNFLSRMNNHFVTTGENLLEKVFDTLTEGQIKELRIKTDIQRTDSFQAASNIRQYSRLQLMIEMLIRIYRVISPEDKLKYKELFEKYVIKSSGQFIYKLPAEDITTELQKIGEVFHKIQTEIGINPVYKEINIFKTFERVYIEHFSVVNEKIVINLPATVSSSSLQSPDDIEATYRTKRGKATRGQSVNIVETANPDNEINLLTDIAINANNKDDSVVLNERIDTIKTKTPDLKELHFDGAYSSKANDEKCEEDNLDILQVQTGIRGIASTTRDIEITEIVSPVLNSESKKSSAENHRYKVSCQYQEVEAAKTRKRYKAKFDETICSKCPILEQCKLTQTSRSAEKGSAGRVYYFTDEEYIKKKRFKNIEKLPLERRSLRNNVEASVSEFRRKMQNRKLKVRGAFRASVFAFSMGVSINFGRIYRYTNKKLTQALENIEPKLANA